MSANAWHTVIAWHDAGNDEIKIQVDNKTPIRLSHLMGTTDSNNSLSIGALPGGSIGLDGRIDEVAIYRRVLTDSERAWIYNEGTRRTYADLTAPPMGPQITYTYGDPAHKHAVTSLSTVQEYFYDANGNMISRIENNQTYTQVFDTQNRLTSVTKSGQTTTFAYDPDGNLVNKTNQDGSKTIYVGGVYEEDKTSGGTVTGTKTYYPSGGAIRITTVSPPSNNLYYVLKDHLGSASVVTDANGITLPSGGEQRYLPYGEKILDPGITTTDKLFTGQRDTGLGIYHYGARFYSPRLGRFLSADSLAPNLTNPQDLNHYSYVLNNPLRFTDPTGNRVWEGEGGSVTAQTIIEDIRRDREFKLETNRNRCEAGDRRYCSYAENHPLETAGFIITGLAGGALAEQAILGGGAMSAAEVAFWRAAQACIGNIVCRLVTGAAGGVGGAGAQDITQLVQQAQQQYPNKAGKIELHHVFPKYLGGDPTGQVVAIDAAYHQVITNAFRDLWKYGQAAPTVEQAQSIMQQVYNRFPLP